MTEGKSVSVSDLECPECGSGLVEPTSQRPDPDKEKTINEYGGGFIGRLRYRLQQIKDPQINPHTTVMCSRCGFQTTADAFN